MSKRADVKLIQPVNFFPYVRPLPQWATKGHRQERGVGILPEPMFYFPGIFKSLDGFWLERSISRALRELQRMGPMDAVDAHFGYPEGVGCVRAAHKLGLPVFITLRGLEAEYIRKPFIGPQLAAAIREADGCICVSHFLKELALDHGADPTKTIVIHNAIDASRFFPGNKQEVRAQLGLPLRLPIVVSIGHLILRKRHHVLVDAFSEVVKHYPGAHLVVIGSDSFAPNYARDLRRRVAARGLLESVRFAGNIPASEIGRWLQAADVFALGTQREGCCNAILEALACGLPVVTTPVGDNSYFVKEGENGYLVPVDDAPAMASAIVRALSISQWDPNAISRSLGVGDWDRVASEVLQFFQVRVKRA